MFSENLAKLFSLMDPNSPERVAFVSRALKWSSGGSGRLGHPRLHQLLALTLWRGRLVRVGWEGGPGPLRDHSFCLSSRAPVSTTKDRGFLLPG